MKLKVFLILSLLVIFISCAEKNTLPANVLPREKMEAVMWDMLRAGEFMDSYIFNRDTGVNKMLESERWYEKIYQLHGITKEQFRQSFSYYKDNLTAFKPILDSLSKKEMEEDSVTSAIPVPSVSPIDSSLLKRRDSLIKVKQKSKLAKKLPSQID